MHLGVCVEKKRKNIYSGGMFYEKSCHVIIKCVKDNMKSKIDRKLYIQYIYIMEVKYIVMQFHVVFKNLQPGQVHLFR